MKTMNSKKLKTFVLGCFLFAGISLFSNHTTQAQNICEQDAFLDECASRLEDFNFLKAYRLNVSNLKKGKDSKKASYSYVFSKNSTYIITVCSGSEEQNGTQMVANLYDRNKKLIASSYDRRKRKHYPAIAFKCTATGVYYLEYTFIGEGDGCGVSILGFKR